MPPLVAITSELVNRGHTLRVLTGPFAVKSPRFESMEESFRSVGCEVLWRDPAVWLDGVPATGTDDHPIPDYLLTVRGAALWHPLSVPWAVQTRDEISDFRPDVVVVDFCMPGAAIAAEEALIPYVILSTTVPGHRLFQGWPVPGRGAARHEDEVSRQDEFLRLYGDTTLPWLNAARARLELSIDEGPWQWDDRAAKHLLLTSPAFDFDGEALPPNYVYTGSLRPSASDKPWESPWATDDARALVVVSSTSTFLSFQWMPVFQAAIEAIADSRIRGLVTLTQYVDPATLPSAENVVMRDYVPHEAVLPLASAIISQCGHGTTMAALRHGVPMVCVPVFGDQPDVAARVVHHGAGIRLSTTSTTAEFHDAIRAVVGEPRYREAARRLAEVMSAEDGASRAADEIEAVAAAPS